MSRTIFRKFYVQAKRKGTQTFSEWTIVTDPDRAAEHAERAAAIGYDSRIVEVLQQATAEEIIKAVKCCQSRDCESCPYDKFDNCATLHQNDVLDLLLEQRKKNARLKGDVKELKAANTELIKQISTLRSIIAEEVIEKIYEKSERIANPYKGRSDKFVLSEASINSILKGFCVKKYEN